MSCAVVSYGLDEICRRSRQRMSIELHLLSIALLFLLHLGIWSRLKSPLTPGVFHASRLEATRSTRLTKYSLKDPVFMHVTRSNHSFSTYSTRILVCPDRLFSREPISESLARVAGQLERATCCARKLPT